MKTTTINHRNIFGIIDLHLGATKELPAMNSGFFEIIEPTNLYPNITIATSEKTIFKFESIPMCLYKKCVLPKLIQKFGIKDIARDITVTDWSGGGLIMSGECVYHGETVQFDIDTITNIPDTAQAARSILIDNIECPAHSFDLPIHNSDDILAVIENRWGEGARKRAVDSGENEFQYVGTLWHDELVAINDRYKNFGAGYGNIFFDVYEYYGTLYLVSVTNGTHQGEITPVIDEKEILDVLF